MSESFLCGRSNIFESSFKDTAIRKKVLEINVRKGYNKFAVQKPFFDDWQINSCLVHNSHKQFANRKKNLFCV